MNTRELIERNAALDRRLAEQARQQIADLKAAGWKPKTDTIWSDPKGCLFAGPNGAWRVMRARQEKKS